MNMQLLKMSAMCARVRQVFLQAEFDSATATDAFGRRDSAHGKQGRTRVRDSWEARENLEASNAVPVIRRAFDSDTEIAGWIMRGLVKGSVYGM